MNVITQPSRRIGYLFLPCWQTDRRLRSGAPDDRSPLVTWVQDGSRRLVSAVCDTARGVGLRPGMRLAQAQAMIPSLDVRPATPSEDAAALVALSGWCQRFTPLTRAEPPDGVWLDLTGCTHLFGGESALLADLSGRLGRAGLSARIAIADTPGAAHALACHGERATVSIPAERLQEALDPLPVAALRLAREQELLLHRFGLRSIGALERVPRGPLTRRLGAGVLLKLDQAFGRVAEAIRPDLPQAMLQERLGFTEPLQTADSLAAANAVLSVRLCLRLEQLCLGARRLDLVFVRLDGSVQVQSVVLARATHAARHVGRLLDERLEQVDPGEGVETIWLLAQIVEPVEAEQTGLGSLAPAWGDALAELAPLIDTLRTRLGGDRLWRPVAVESDVPERSVSRRPPLSPEPGSWPACLPRPVRLIEPPQPVRALAGLPDHPPVWFVWRRRQHRVRRADGPERIAGEWWRRGAELSALRDYFRVEDETGRCFWLFRRGDGRDPSTGDLDWFLHGLF